ncbi:MAG: endonuclease III [Pseudomonadota bacterium]
MSPENIEAIFAEFVKKNPNPRTELTYKNGYTLLCAVLLSAQATDVSVNKATKDLFIIADTPEKMVALGEAEIISHIRTIGLFRNKAKNMLAMSHILIEKFNSEVPNTLEDLMSLPGVGRKTANVVLNEFFHIPTCAVDTHVFRVSNRTGLAPGKNVDSVEQKLLEVIPEKYLLDAHHHLILHGRYVCKARKPDCYLCNIKEYCSFENKILDNI